MFQNSACRVLYLRRRYLFSVTKYKRGYLFNHYIIIICRPSTLRMCCRHRKQMISKTTEEQCFNFPISNGDFKKVNNYNTVRQVPIIIHTVFWSLQLNDREGIWQSLGVKQAEKEYAEQKGQGLTGWREEQRANLGVVAIKSLDAEYCVVEMGVELTLRRETWIRPLRTLDIILRIVDFI